MKHRDNMSAAELAGHAGVTKAAISKILHGRTKQPTPKTLFRIADALNYEARYIATGEGPKTKEESAADSLDLSDFSSESRVRIRKIVDTFKEPDGNPANSST